MSPSEADKIMWKIELLPNDQSKDEWKVAPDIPYEYRWTKPKYFDTVRVSVSLEAIKYEYALRYAVAKARKEYPDQFCVCDRLQFPKEHEQEFWASESGYLSS
jgi:hypothetical protein